MYLPFSTEEFYEYEILFDDYIGINKQNETNHSEHGMVYFNAINGEPVGDFLFNENSPSLHNNGWNLNINSIDVQWNTGYPTIEFSLEFPYFFFHDDYKIRINTYDSIDIEFLVNQEYEYSFEDIELSTGKAIDYEILIPFNALEEDIIIDISLESENGYLKQEQIFIPSKRETNYNIDLINNDSYNISLPISIDDNEILYEIFSFSNNIGITKYPTLLNDSLITLDYYNSKTSIDPNKNLKSDLKIDNLKGINDLYHNIELENNKIYIDDYYHYNFFDKEINKGTSANYPSYNSLILPWDYDNNISNASIELIYKTYTETHFNIDFQIGNLNKLRGDKHSRFFWEENNFYIFNDANPNYSFTIPNLEQEQITISDIEEWLNE